MISNMVCSFLLSGTNVGGALSTAWSRLRRASSEIRLEPLLHPFGGTGDARGLRARLLCGDVLVAPFEQKADGGRIAGAAHDVGEPADVGRYAHAHRQMEDFLAELGHA